MNSCQDLGSDEERVSIVPLYRGNTGKPGGHATILYLDCGGSYANPHMWIRQLRTAYPHPWVHIKLVKSEQLYGLYQCQLPDIVHRYCTVSFWYWTIITWHVIIEENWMKDTQDLLLMLCCCCCHSLFLFVFAICALHALCLPYLLMPCLHHIPDQRLREVEKFAQAYSVCQKRSWDWNSDLSNYKARRVSMTTASQTGESLTAPTSGYILPFFPPPHADLYQVLMIPRL